MTTESDKRRNRLSKAYPGWSWQEKVAGWDNEQVTAVFLRFERDGWPQIEPKINPDLKPDNLKPPDPPKSPDDDDQLPLF
jgi:hypothetical protein